VSAHSEGLGHGSSFVVRLPILVETPRETSPEERSDYSVAGQRVLIVDDNVDSAKSLALLLRLNGSDTQSAHDGVEAVEKAAAYRPDAILLDIGLPKMNGYDACRAIRKEPWGKDMVIVALTGWGQDEDRRKSEQAGFNGHFVKPVDFAALIKLLCDLKQSPVEA
jgi:CheY-like chemotaxis protein